VHGLDSGRRFALLLARQGWLVFLPRQLPPVHGLDSGGSVAVVNFLPGFLPAPSQQSLRAMILS
jgi:hypothetical protein